MSEIIALTRLSVARSRWLLNLSIAYLFLLHVGLAIYRQIAYSGSPADLRQETFFAVLGGSLSLPLLGTALMLFDFTDRTDIGSRASGFSHWMLRTPVKSWKLALVPIVLKTAWIFVVFAAIAVTSDSFGMPLKHWVIASVGVSTLVAGAVVLAWIPFRRTYTRLCLYGILIVPAYAAFIACMSLAYGQGMNNFPHEQVNPPLNRAAVLAIYTLIMMLAVRTVAVARRNVDGVIPESRPWFTRTDRHTRVQHHAGQADTLALISSNRPPGQSAQRTLVRYDLAKLSGPLGAVLIIAWLLMVLFWSAADTMDPSGLILLIAMMAYPAVFACENMIQGRDASFLPNLLAMSPIATTKLVWTRQLVVTAIWLASLMGLPIILAAWILRGSCGELFRSWNASTNSHFGTADAGWRVAAALVLGLLLLVLRQTTWSTAAAATGNRRYALYVFLGKFAIAFALFSWLLFHFLRFPNWEAWSEWAWVRVSELPILLPWLLIAKMTIAIVATVALARSELTQTQLPWILLGVYTLGSILLGWIFWRLIPSDSLALWHAIIAAAILLPYSRITLAPLCLALNRHR